MHNPFEYILNTPPLHMVGDGFRVHTILPTPQLPAERTSPFYLLDYNPPWQVPPGETPLGVSVHPHRGFETVTFALQGKIAHHDSRGNAGVIGPGDVQWMTAGSGILHKEYHEKEFSKAGGILQMVQLWVNLPAAQKMSMPGYQPIFKSDMGQRALPGNSGHLTVVAGQVGGCIGPARTASAMQVFLLQLAPGAEFEFEIEAGFNTCLLLMEGGVQSGKQTLEQRQLAVVHKKASRLHLKATGASQCLDLSGQPLNEPIAAYGPFLMNTRQELMQAVDDFNNGLFGELKG